MTYTYARRYRGPLKAVILDWAGTTLDYGCYAPAVVFTEVFKRRVFDILGDIESIASVGLYDQGPIPSGTVGRQVGAWDTAI